MLHERNLLRIKGHLFTTNSLLFMTKTVLGALFTTNSLLFTIRSPIYNQLSSIYNQKLFRSRNLRIQPEYRKIRTRKTPYLDTFHEVPSLPFTTKIRHDYYPYLQLENTHRTNSKTAPWHTILHMIYLMKLAGYQIHRMGNSYVAQFFLSFFFFVLYSDLVMSFCLFSFLFSLFCS